MKKLLMLGAILVLGATAMGDTSVSETNTAPVYLKAEITSDNLIISGIDGRDILLDFGRISKNALENRGRGAKAEFKVEYVGDFTNKIEGNTLDIRLERAIVDMNHTTISGAKKMEADLRISDRLGTTFTPNNDGLEANDIKLKDITKKGEIYRGEIDGMLASEDIRAATDGMYEGATQLTVTLNGTQKDA